MLDRRNERSAQRSLCACALPCMRALHVLRVLRAVHALNNLLLVAHHMAAHGEHLSCGSLFTGILADTHCTHRVEVHAGEH